MKITHSKRIADIKAEFCAQYPGLKIGFYKNPHSHHKGSPANEEIDDNQTIGEVTNKIDPGNINLSEDQTVSAVESAFEEQFGLHVQVFRRSNNLWLQTSATDHWTLDVQNGKGLRSVQN